MERSNSAVLTEEKTAQHANLRPEHRNVKLLDEKEVLRKNRGYWRVRRAQDILFSLMAIIILSPIMLIVALAVVINDPKGGPIYTSERVGRDGKTFHFYKFRSMCVDAEDMLDDLLDQNEMSGPAFKIREDPRITKVGRFIRKFSIDELPQLFNILKGDMSIVGPRPPLPREVELYDDYELQRLYVTPGLTCYWQTQPHRNDLSFEEWLELDLRYIENRSFLEDWKIIFRTFGVVVKGDSI